MERRVEDHYRTIQLSPTRIIEISDHLSKRHSRSEQAAAEEAKHV